MGCATSSPAPASSLGSLSLRSGLKRGFAGPGAIIPLMAGGVLFSAWAVAPAAEMHFKPERWQERKLLQTSWWKSWYLPAHS